jgi:hypothetical protein
MIPVGVQGKLTNVPVGWFGDARQNSCDNCTLMPTKSATA